VKPLVALLVTLPFLGTCGGDSSLEDEVRAAVAEYFEALHDEDAQTFCDKMFPSTLLPSRIADRLTFVPPADSGGSPARWDDENRVCPELLGRRGQLDANGSNDVSVIDVTFLEPFEETEKITAVANARVRANGRVQTLPVVQFDDDWNVVFAVR
jgi:hypothetical protein